MTEIEAKDVVKIVLQFLKESELTSTFESLQKESGGTLNTVRKRRAVSGRSSGFLGSMLGFIGEGPP